MPRAKPAGARKDSGRAIVSVEDLAYLMAAAQASLTVHGKALDPKHRAGLRAAIRHASKLLDSTT